MVVQKRKSSQMFLSVDVKTHGICPQRPPHVWLRAAGAGRDAPPGEKMMKKCGHEKPFCWKTKAVLRIVFFFCLRLFLKGSNTSKPRCSPGFCDCLTGTHFNGKSIHHIGLAKKNEEFFPDDHKKMFPSIFCL